MTNNRWKKQTEFYVPGISKGNCMQAAVASLFDIPIEDVPHFIMQEQWMKAFKDFIALHGYILLVRYAPDEGKLYIPKGYHLVCGPANRGCEHMVIYHNGNLFHDPHPSNDGLISVTEFWQLLPADPAMLKLKVNE